MTRPVNNSDIPQQPMLVSPWMPLAEVAAYWRCAQSTVKRMAKEGHLSPRYLPGRKHFPLFHRDQVVQALPWAEPDGIRAPTPAALAESPEIAALSPLARQLAGITPPKGP